MAVQITPAQEQPLDDLAQKSVDRVLAYEEDLHATVKRGRADIAAGRLLEHDEVFSRIDALLNG